ncbi:MAG: hypothetical protein KJ718_04570 [Nanoarchaeota archaeon]|nr:hypothetical protein [Nanoarchaeota archaeon]MBU1051800.1 hypothetical protein [Nanoarchaeota archaeon]
MIPHKQRILMTILFVLLILSIGYILIDKYNEKRQQEQLNAFQQGAQAGYEQAVIQIVQQALTCQSVPLYVENQTINVIAVECLQKQPED